MNDIRRSVTQPHMDHFLETLGEDISVANEETFDLFSYSRSSQDLGMVDAKAEEITVSIAGRDVTIRQSPGILRSNREGGTTGAAVWRVSVALAEWLGYSESPLFKQNVITAESVVLELGAGISGVVSSMLIPRVKRVVATDQQYALKLLEENINNALPSKLKGSKLHKSKARPNIGNVDIAALDWERDDISSFLNTHGLQDGVDILLVCDCVFNYALIAPLVDTCTEVCRARRKTRVNSETENLPPTLCIIAQQLRQPDVFEEWLQVFLEKFKVWRIPSDVLNESLKEGSGFVVHIGILR